MADHTPIYPLEWTENEDGNHHAEGRETRHYS
jgi:hypothetical protein